MLFTSGPCTQGPGTVVELDLDKGIRTHHELDRGVAEHFRNGCEFYRKVGERMGQ